MTSTYLVAIGALVRMRIGETRVFGLPGAPWVAKVDRVALGHVGDRPIGSEFLVYNREGRCSGHDQA